MRARAARGHACEELRHRRRVGEDAVDRPALHQITDPAGERGVAQDRDAERFVARKSRQSAPPGARSRQGGEMAFPAQGAQMLGVLPVARIVDEAPEVHHVRAGEVRQEVIGADLFALVGRIGDAMREKQDLRQSPHPRPREIPGPSALATNRGRRRHTAIRTAYFGFSGLRLGISRVRSNRYSWCSGSGSKPQIRL